MMVVTVIYIEAIVFFCIFWNGVNPPLSWIYDGPNTTVVVPRLLLVRMVDPGSKSVENPCTRGTKKVPGIHLDEGIYQIMIGSACICSKSVYLKARWKLERD